MGLRLRRPATPADRRHLTAYIPFLANLPISQFTGKWDDLFGSLTSRNSPSPPKIKSTAGRKAYRAGITYPVATNPPKYWHAPPAPPNTGKIASHAIKHLPSNFGESDTTENDYPAAIAAFSEMLEIWRTISPKATMLPLS